MQNSTKVTVTKQKLLNSWNVLYALSNNKEIPFKIRYTITRNLTSIKSKLFKISKQVRHLLGGRTIELDDLTKKELEDLFNQEVEIEIRFIRKIDISQFISHKELEKINFILWEQRPRIIQPKEKEPMPYILV
jgi:hypothetical protein